MDMRRELLGIALVLFIGVCFALANTFAGLAYQGGSDPLSVSTARFVLPTAVLLIILLVRKQRILLPRRDGIAAAALGVVTVVYTWALLTAIDILPVPLAVLIFYLFPVFTSFILAGLGWERMRPIAVGAAVIAFAGLALALGVSGQGLNLVGVGLGIVAAIGLATVSAVSSRVIRSGDPRQATLYMAATALVTFLVITSIHGDFALPQTDAGWWGFAGSNIFYAIAMIGFFVGISMIGPAKTTLFSYIEPIATIGAAFVLLGQVLLPLQSVGVLIVVGALVIAGIAGTRRKAPPADQAHCAGK